MNDDKLIAAYESARADVHKSVELHAQHLWQFLTLLVAVLTLTFAGAGYLPGERSKAIALLIGGSTGVVVALCGRAMCNRFYEGMLEGITVSAKLEGLMGLDARPPNPTPFPEDTVILPARWIANRSRHKKSESFAEAMNAGANRVARATFWALTAINAIVVLYALYRMFQPAV